MTTLHYIPSFRMNSVRSIDMKWREEEEGTKDGWDGNITKGRQYTNITRV